MAKLIPQSVRFGRRFPRLCPLPLCARPLCAMAALALLWALPVQAQRSDEPLGPGTQFVRPPRREAPAPPAETVPPPQPPQPPKAPEAPPVPPPAPPATAVDKPPSRFPTVFLLLDASDSMLNKDGPDGRTHLDEAKEALVKLLREMTPQTRVQLWSFNSRMWPVPVGNLPPGRFASLETPGMRQALIAQVRNIRAMGGTNLYASVVKALGYFGEPAQQALYRSGERFPVLVIVSDGEDSGRTRENLQSVMEAKAAHPLVNITTIGFRVPGESEWAAQLCRIASSPKGCATAGDAQRLEALLKTFYKPLAP